MCEEERRKMIELLEKLRYRISVSPDSPENENAKRVLARQMEKWGITEDDFKKLVPILIEFNRKDFALKLLVQLAYVKFGINLTNKPFYWGKYGFKFIKCDEVKIPEEQLKEFKEQFLFYEKQYIKKRKEFEKDLKKEIEEKRKAFNYSFLYSAGLLAPATDMSETSAEELKRILEEMERFRKNPVQGFTKSLEQTKQIGVDK
jgi:hypothetical protein